MEWTMGNVIHNACHINGVEIGNSRYISTENQSSIDGIYDMAVQSGKLPSTVCLHKIVRSSYYFASTESIEGTV